MAVAIQFEVMQFGGEYCIGTKTFFLKIANNRPKPFMKLPKCYFGSVLNLKELLKGDLGVKAL